MGCYINPKDLPKEKWLLNKGILTTKDDVLSHDYNDPCVGFVPVVLIDNGAFQAASVLFNEAERDRFLLDRTDRPRTFWFVDIEDVRTVSPYDLYTK